MPNFPQRTHYAKSHVHCTRTRGQDLVRFRVKACWRLTTSQATFDAIFDHINDVRADQPKVPIKRTRNILYISSPSSFDWAQGTKSIEANLMRGPASPALALYTYRLAVLSLKRGVTIKVQSATNLNRSCRTVSNNLGLSMPVRKQSLFALDKRDNCRTTLNFHACSYIELICI